MNPKLQAPYGLKFHPFRPDIPTDALFVTPTVDAFCRRVEFSLAGKGLAMVAGDPGSGKSIALRVFAEHAAADLPPAYLSFDDSVDEHLTHDTHPGDLL